MKIRTFIAGFLLFSLVFMASACKDKNLPEPDFLEIKEENLHLGFSAQTSAVSFSISTNAKALTFETDDPWCQARYHYENKTITITVSDNASLDARSATIAVKHGSLNETIQVMQLGVNPVIMMAQNKLALSSELQDIEVRVTSNVALSFSTQASWITHLAGEKSAVITPVQHVFGFRVSALQETL